MYRDFNSIFSHLLPIIFLIWKIFNKVSFLPRFSIKLDSDIEEKDDNLISLPQEMCVKQWTF